MVDFLSQDKAGKSCVYLGIYRGMSPIVSNGNIMIFPKDMRPSAFTVNILNNGRYVVEGQ